MATENNRSTGRTRGKSSASDGKTTIPATAPTPAERDFADPNTGTGSAEDRNGGPGNGPGPGDPGAGKDDSLLGFDPGAFAQSFVESASRSEPDPAPKGSKTRRGTTAKAEKVEASAVEVATDLVTMSNVMVCGIVGYEAQINPIESTLIIKALGDMLASSDNLAKVAGVANPFALILGVGMWGVRIVGVWQAKHPAKPKPPKNVPQAQAVPTAPAPVPATAPDKIEVVVEPDDSYLVIAKRNSAMFD